MALGNNIDNDSMYLKRLMKCIFFHIPVHVVGESLRKSDAQTIFFKIVEGSTAAVCPYINTKYAFNELDSSFYAITIRGGHLND